MDDDDFKDVYDLAPKPVSEKDIRWWSKYMRKRHFPTEQAARDEIFRILQHNDTQSWSELFGKKGEEQNRHEADTLPVYQNRYRHWRVGRPMSYWKGRELPGDAEERQRQKEVQAILQRRRSPGQVQEYLSNFTSDFSDGTNGEPSAPAPYAGDAGTAVGIPDYKYLERKQARHAKLRALMQRRDPSKTSRVAWDRNTRAGLKESEDADMMKEVGYSPNLALVPAYGVKEGYNVDASGKFLGDIRKEAVEDMPKLPQLRQLNHEFPWVARSTYTSYVKRHKTKNEAAYWLWTISQGSKDAGGYDPESKFWARAKELRDMPPDDLQALLNQESNATSAKEIVNSLILS